MTIVVRTEQAGDIAEIRAIVEAAFPKPLEAELVDQLRLAGDSVISLVAVEPEAILGHVVLSRMSAPLKALGLGPVSVRPDHQRKGIGTALIREAIAHAADDGWQAIFVLGAPAYYRRFGFNPDLARGFTSPYAGPHLMVLPLGAEMPTREGRIDYAKAFAALG